MVHLDEFEKARRLRETTNERIINLLRAGTLGLSLVTQAIALRIPDLTIRPPRALMQIEAAVIALSLLFWYLLAGQPAYHPWRKYAITLFELAAAFVLIGTLRGPVDEAFGLVMSIPVFLLLVVGSGLRYSPPVVLLAGGGAIVLHVAQALPRVGVPFRIPAIQIGAVLLLSGTTVVAYIVESLLRLHRQSVSKDRLRRFLPPEVVDQIEGAPEVALGAVEREVTVVFSDISGFTKMSSTMKPKDVVELLNDYFPTMVDIVFRHGGTLEKYIGDALLAVWGAPVPWIDAADRALAAAVDMQKAVGELNRRWLQKGRPTIAIHVGLHTGQVAAGNIGTAEYLQYACIGDTTNVSSRVCGVAEADELIVSESTRSRLARTGWRLEALPPVSVKGMDLPLSLHRVDWRG